MRLNKTVVFIQIFIHSKDRWMLGYRGDQKVVLVVISADSVDKEPDKQVMTIV